MTLKVKNDIRGKYPSEVNETMAENIGRVAPYVMSKRWFGKPVTKVVVGRDGRTSSEALHQALIKGLQSQGIIVCDVGICSTPKFYFAGWYYNFEAGIMVTASHNPKQYNGFKFIEENATSLSYKKGIKKLLKEIEKPPKDKKQGEVVSFNIDADYTRFLKEKIEHGRKLKILVDPGNGMGSLDAKVLTRHTISKLNYTIDGTFPNRSPNPSIPKHLEKTCAKVKSTRADLGIAFDGDADRVMFIDEKGNVVQTDVILALLVDHLAKKGDTIEYDHHLSKEIRELARAKGVYTVKARIGHAFMSATLRERKGLLGGEYSGHYYFKENAFADSGILAAIYVTNIVAKKRKPFSKILEAYKKYAISSEINVHVTDRDKAVKEVEKAIKGKHEHFDGVTISTDAEWINIRKSNTESVVRLRAESNTEDEVDALINLALQAVKKTQKTKVYKGKKQKKKHGKKSR